ncbi:MAG: sigma-E processing peptidase SpoIIGA [Clostridiales bacterium]|nr:sigma-E processing peptidase SpoIIGA [Clostridiales bacterium]
MSVTVYLDVYFLVNFAADVVILTLTGKAMGLFGRGWFRIFFGAAIGSLWACTDLILVAGGRFPVWLEWAITCPVVGSLMILSSFGRRRFNDFVRCVLILWLVGAVLGGFCGVTMRWLCRSRLLSVGRIWRQWTLVQAGCTGIALYFLGSAMLRSFRSVIAAREAICLVRLHEKGNTREVTALWDTGNRLREPYGGQPVHVITASGLGGLCERVSAMIYIPYCSVGKEQGILPAIRIEQMDVIRNQKEVFTLEHPWLAIVKEPLSPDHRYEMLLHGEWMGRIQKMDNNRNLEDAEL